MSLILNKQYVDTQLYNKFLNKKQSHKCDLANNSNSQYGTNLIKSNLYSTNVTFTGYAIRILAKDGKLQSEVFQTTKSRREINKLLNNLGNLDDSIPKEAKELENTKKEIEKLLKNREIIEISVDNLKKPFKKLLSSQPEKVRSGSKLVKWLIDLNILPQIPSMDPIYRNLLENKETVNPIMEFIGYLADGNKLKVIPDDVVTFIKGKSKFGKPEEISMAGDTLNKLREANLITREQPHLMSENTLKNKVYQRRLLTNVSIDNIEDVLTGLKSKDPNIALPSMVILKYWIKKGAINNHISVDNIKDFFNLIKEDNDVSQQVGLTIIDSLANYRNSSLKQFFEKEANAIEPIINKFDPKIYKFDSEEDLPIVQKLAVKATHKLIQNNYIKIIPEEHAEVIARRLDPKYIKNPKRDLPKMGHALKTVEKLVDNYLKEGKPVNFIPDRNILYILELTHHSDGYISKEALSITRNLLRKTDLIKSIPDEDIKGILENLNKEDSNILIYSMSIIRLIIKRDIKEPEDFITQTHINHILELTNNSCDNVSCSAIDTVNMLLKVNFKDIETRIDADNKIVGNLINKLNSDNHNVILATMRLIRTLNDKKLLKKSTEQKAMFRNQLINQADYIEITPETFKRIKEKINFENEEENFYFQKTKNIFNNLLNMD